MGQQCPHTEQVHFAAGNGCRRGESTMLDNCARDGLTLGQRDVRMGHIR